MLGRVAPADVDRASSATRLAKISDDNAGGLLTLAFLFTLWSSSGAVVSMCTTLNAAYDITEGRPWWKVRLVAIGLTVGLALFMLVVDDARRRRPCARAADRGRRRPRHRVRMDVEDRCSGRWCSSSSPRRSRCSITSRPMPSRTGSGSRRGRCSPPSSGWSSRSASSTTSPTSAATPRPTASSAASWCCMLWFYLSGIAILVGAELNAEIEHASPYGKDVGEKVPGEKEEDRSAARSANTRSGRPRGDPDPALPRGRELRHRIGRKPEQRPVRPSDLLIGAAVLLPAAIKVGGK